MVGTGSTYAGYNFDTSAAPAFERPPKIRVVRHCLVSARGLHEEARWAATSAPVGGNHGCYHDPLLT
jgi:hypothetical protein